MMFVRVCNPPPPPFCACCSRCRFIAVSLQAMGSNAVSRFWRILFPPLPLFSFLRPFRRRRGCIMEPLQTTGSCAYSEDLDDMFASRCRSDHHTSAIGRSRNSLRYFQNTSFALQVCRGHQSEIMQPPPSLSCARISALSEGIYRLVELGPQRQMFGTLCILVAVYAGGGVGLNAP